MCTCSRSLFLSLHSCACSQNCDRLHQCFNAHREDGLTPHLLRPLLSSHWCHHLSTDGLKHDRLHVCTTPQPSWCKMRIVRCARILSNSPCILRAQDMIRELSEALFNVKREQSLMEVRGHTHRQSTFVFSDPSPYLPCPAILAAAHRYWCGSGVTGRQAQS